MEQNYAGVKACLRAKRVQVALVPPLARQLAGQRIAVQAMHPRPGVYAWNRQSLLGFNRAMLHSAEEGADTVVWLASAQPAHGPAISITTGGFGN